MAQNTNENAENTQVSQEELSELLKVRREKLEKLQSEGKESFPNCKISCRHTFKRYFK